MQKHCELTRKNPRRLGFMAIFLISMALSKSGQSADDPKSRHPSPSEHLNQPVNLTGQLTTDEWQNIVKTYEAQIADHGATVAALNNLALARFKLNDVPQAIAAWVAAWSRDPRDDEVRLGLRTALQTVGLNLDALDLEAHGPYQSWVAKKGEVGHRFILKGALASLAICIFILFTWLLNIADQKLTRSVQRSLVVVSVLFSCFVWGYYWIHTLHMGIWGAVVSKEPTPFYLAPNQRTDAAGKLPSGTPIFVVGDSYGAWLQVKSSDGVQGWVEATKIRLIR